ncbi:MAG: hypothetical protein IPK19_20405 [Chloroflexi bacterium]|nr:hypothetical protein [Chloroflexota bacterium]
MNFSLTPFSAKVAHHSSHNATLSGTAASDYPNLEWMGLGSYAREFTAMITAVPAWAKPKPPGWNHPLPAIREALDRKAAGRVFQTDTDLKELKKPITSSRADWDEFLARAKEISCTSIT